MNDFIPASLVSDARRYARKERTDMVIGYDNYFGWVCRHEGDSGGVANLSPPTLILIQIGKPPMPFDGDARLIKVRGGFRFDREVSAQIFRT